MGYVQSSRSSEFIQYEMIPISRYTFFFWSFQPRSEPSKPYKLKDTSALQASMGITLKQYSPIDLSRFYTKIDEMVLSFYKNSQSEKLKKMRNTQLTQCIY
jgi:hypothetical protein